MCPLPNHDIDDAALIGFDPRNYFFRDAFGLGAGMGVLVPIYLRCMLERALFYLEFGSSLL